MLYLTVTVCHSLPLPLPKLSQGSDCSRFYSNWPVLMVIWILKFQILELLKLLKHLKNVQKEVSTEV